MQTWVLQVGVTKCGKIRALDIHLYANGGSSLGVSGLVMSKDVLSDSVIFFILCVCSLVSRAIPLEIDFSLLQFVVWLYRGHSMLSYQ